MPDKVDIASAYRERRRKNQASREPNFIVHTALVKQLDGVYQSSKVHQFTVYSDEHPEPWGGGDRAPSPFQYLLSSLGFSINNQVFIQSKVAGVELRSLECLVEGSFDAKGFYGVKGHEPSVNKISIEFRIKSSAPESAIRKIVGAAALGCPVYRTLAKSAKIERLLVLNGGGAKR